MPTLINFKICDNSKDCSGISVCPKHAFSWNELKKTIVINNDLCISCGLCAKACPVSAIHIAKTKEDFKKIKREIEKDPRKVSNLLVDRYGTEPYDPAFCIPQEKFVIQILESAQPAVVEFFNWRILRCRLYSIPIKELLPDIKIKYRKIEANISDKLIQKYQIKQMPTLVFFNNGKLIGKIEGYYPAKKKRLIITKIKKVLENI